MTLSKTGILTGTILFFLLISSFIGFFELYTNNNIETTGESNLNNAHISFIPAVIQGYAELPTIINVVIFGTIGSVLAWIIITTFLPAVDSGS